MNIAPIKYDNSRRYKSANPSFQNLKIMTPEHWDKDILDLVKHNAEIKKIEKYLWEKKHSILELTISNHGRKFQSSEGITLECIYDRHRRVEGLREHIVHNSPKEIVIAELKKFKASKFIQKIEDDERKFLQSVNYDAAKLKNLGLSFMLKNHKTPKANKKSWFMNFIDKIF